MKTTINGKTLIIEIDLNAPRPSQSGKTKIVASTGGFAVTEAMIDGKPVSVSVNATIKA